jgi:hypothetical protein
VRRALAAAALVAATLGAATLVAMTLGAATMGVETLGGTGTWAPAAAAPVERTVAPAVARPGVTAPFSVRLDRASIDAGPGQKIRFVSTVRNTGSRPLSGLVAHLDILTTDPNVYVDPEDWSALRTQYLDRLAPGGSARVEWAVRAVTSGPLVLYVSVTRVGTHQIAVSGPLRMTVHGQRVVNAQQVMPLVAWTPATVLALLGLTMLRRRRHR